MIYRLMLLGVNSRIEVKSRKCCQVPKAYAKRPMLDMDGPVHVANQCDDGIIFDFVRLCPILSRAVYCSVWIRIPHLGIISIRMFHRLTGELTLSCRP